MAKQKYFAISKGRRTGVFFGDWSQFEHYVKGFSGARFKSFGTEAEAQAFFSANGGGSLNDAGHDSPPVAPRPAKRAKAGPQPPRFAPPGATLAQPAGRQAAAAAAAAAAAVGTAHSTTTAALPTSSSGDRDGAGALQSDDQLFLVEFDGASRGNPGIAGAGALVRASTSGRIVFRAAERLPNTTNNVAEYQGLILGLREAARLGARNVQAVGDSMLVVNQMNGTWRVSKPHLAPLRAEAAALGASFNTFSIKHVLREYNKDADELSNDAIDKGSSRTLLLPTD